jgi:hypothetical protein
MVIQEAAFRSKGQFADRMQLPNSGRKGAEMSKMKKKKFFLIIVRPTLPWKLQGITLHNKRPFSSIQLLLLDRIDTNANSRLICHKIKAAPESKTKILLQNNVSSSRVIDYTGVINYSRVIDYTRVISLLLDKWWDKNNFFQHHIIGG